jgi:hypothetical protein
MDWAKLKASNTDLRGVTAIKRYKPSEIAMHNKKEDCWMALSGKIYNVTQYMKYHPGGVGQLMRGAGKNATDLFMKVHPWVNIDHLLGDKCLVGYLVPEDQGASTATAAQNMLGAGLNPINTATLSSSSTAGKSAANHQVESSSPTTISIPIPDSIKAMAESSSDGEVAFYSSDSSTMSLPNNSSKHTTQKANSSVFAVPGLPASKSVPTKERLTSSTSTWSSTSSNIDNNISEKGGDGETEEKKATTSWSSWLGWTKM